MRLLVLSPQAPWPPVSGARLRVYHLLRAAAGAHQVDLLSFGTPEDDAAARPVLAQVCDRLEFVPPPLGRGLPRRAARTFTRPWPDLAERLWSPPFRARLASLLASRRYDAVQAAGLEMGRYLLGIRGPARILDEFNVEHLLQSGVARAAATAPAGWPGAAYSLIQAAKLRAYEAGVCRAADLVLAVSDADAAELRTLAPTPPIAVVPNGVDTLAFPYREPTPLPRPTLLFSGTLDYRPNADAALWFVRAVLPLLEPALPGVRFFAVGHRPPAALVEAGKRDRAVAVTGSVSNLDPYWDRAAIYVLPMRMGGGVRFKALEALSLGIPLVSTAFGVQGLDAQPYQHYLRAETAAEFVSAITGLLADFPLRQRLARAGRQLVEQYHDWRHVAPRLLLAYASVGLR